MLEKVRKHIAELLGIKEGIITPDSKLVEDLKADSLDIVQMLIVIEDEFNVEFSDDEIASLKTVGDIVAFIEKKNK
ncbi:MAG: Acyl carrier protein [Firmicutes bacterium ADurb.Bin080]|nr:MAG: Acyl carrier protein [Firmicutes bacterium ADurb.Bin080]